MKKQLLIPGIAVLLLTIGLSGCIQEPLISEGNAKFTMGEVITTSELEIYNLWTDENETLVSNNTKFVIISITIENREDKWLLVKTTGFTGLIDDEGNTYESNESFIEINDSIYPIEQLTLIEENETLLERISPYSTELRKIVFEIPMDREPKKLSLSYGFSTNKLANVEIWSHIEIEIVE